MRWAAVGAGLVAALLAATAPAVLEWARPLPGYLRIPLVVLDLSAMTLAALASGVALQEWRIAERLRGSQPEDGR